VRQESGEQLLINDNDYQLHYFEDAALGRTGLGDPGDGPRTGRIANM
jgi:hypothetical protein